MGKAMGDLVKATNQGALILGMIQKDYPNYHPLIAIAQIGHDTENVDVRTRLDCHKTIARYTVPELKSIEVKSEHKETKRVIVSLFTEAAVDEEDTEAVVHEGIATLVKDELNDNGVQALQVPAEGHSVQSD